MATLVKTKLKEKIQVFFQHLDRCFGCATSVFVIVTLSDLRGIFAFLMVLRTCV